MVQREVQEPELAGCSGRGHGTLKSKQESNSIPNADGSHGRVFNNGMISRRSSRRGKEAKPQRPFRESVLSMMRDNRQGMSPRGIQKVTGA